MKTQMWAIIRAFALLAGTCSAGITFQTIPPYGGSATTTSPSATASPSSPASYVNSSIDFSSPIRGVNLGGWLEVEFFLTPSLFENSNALTEHSLTWNFGKEKSKKLLEPHWDTFYQESDFKTMASWGINTIRIPVGYYAFLLRPTDPYVDGQLPYLNRAIKWAGKYGMQVIIDLHIVPGWANYENIDELGTPWIKSEGDIEDTVETIRRIAGNVTENWAGTVTGIELMNEPILPSINPFGPIFLIGMTDQEYLKKLHAFYTKAIEQVPKGISVIINNYSAGPPMPNDWFLDDERVVYDYHYYDLNTTNLTAPSRAEENIPASCHNIPTWYGNDTRKHIIGEFSALRSECEREFSGLSSSVPACSGVLNISSSYWSSEYKETTRRYVEAQLDGFEHASNGWIFWAYKTENRIMMDLRLLIEYGLFPLPFDERKYPGQCNYTSS